MAGTVGSFGEGARVAWRPLGEALGITVVRFALMLATLEAAGLVGVGGWYLGLTANVAATIYGVVLMTRRRLWRGSGFAIGWRSGLAAVAMLPLVAEAASGALGGGYRERDPGFALWGVSLLLAALNEELISRGVILDRLRRAYRPSAAVALTGALFGLQHLSQFAFTSRAADDILLNVLASGIYGFALAAFQDRFRWLWPLVLVHAAANFGVILASDPLPDAVLYVTHGLLLVYGVALLRGTTTSGWRGAGPKRGALTASRALRRG